MKIIKFCLNCKKEFNATPYAIKKGEGKYCSHHCQMIYRNKINHVDQRERFLLGISTEMNENDCWIWAKAKDKDGYGQFDNMRSHRFSYVLFKGEIPVNMIVCHSCDNPSCVNPDHLWIGTHKDNALDRDLKNRANIARGSRQRMSKLTEEKVKLIKRRIAEGIRSCDLSKEFNISNQVISQIRHHKAWRHVE